MSFIKKTKLIEYFESGDKLINEFEYNINACYLSSPGLIYSMSKGELINKFNYDIKARYLSSPGSDIDTYKKYKNYINNDLEDEENINLDNKEKNEIDEYKKNVLIKLKNEILKEYEIKYIYMNITVGTDDACLKITLNDNCKINAYKLFYLNSLAYYIQDKNNDCADLIHNGYIFIKVYNNYIICDCSTDS